MQLGQESCPVWTGPLTTTSREMRFSLSAAERAELNDLKTKRVKVGGVRVEGSAFTASSSHPTRQGLPPSSPLRPTTGPPPPSQAGHLACLLLCQRGPSYHCSTSHIASQDFSSQDVYLERNSRWVLLTHTLVALPDSQGSGPVAWPPAICGLRVETAAVATGEAGWPDQ